MPTGFGSGSHSLTIFTAAGLKSDVGIWLFGNERRPVNGLRSGRPIAEKSPARIAADGTRPERVVGLRRWFVPWYDPKKNVRFRTIGPPKVPPYCERFSPSSMPGVKKLVALNL